MKTILATGAGSGFGEAVALGLARVGHRVIGILVQTINPSADLTGFNETMGEDMLRGVQAAA